MVVVNIAGTFGNKIFRGDPRVALSSKIASDGLISADSCGFLSNGRNSVPLYFGTLNSHYMVSPYVSDFFKCSYYRGWSMSIDSAFKHDGFLYVKQFIPVDEQAENFKLSIRDNFAVLMKLKKSYYYMKAPFPRKNSIVFSSLALTSEYQKVGYKLSGLKHWYYKNRWSLLVFLRLFSISPMFSSVSLFGGNLRYHASYFRESDFVNNWDLLYTLNSNIYFSNYNAFSLSKNFYYNSNKLSLIFFDNFFERWLEYNFVKCLASSKVSLNRTNYVLNLFNVFFDIIVLFKLVAIIFGSFQIRFSLLLLLNIVYLLFDKIMLFINNLFMLRNIGAFSLFSIFLKFREFVVLYYKNILESFFKRKNFFTTNSSSFNYLLSFEKMYFLGYFSYYLYNLLMKFEDFKFISNFVASKSKFDRFSFKFSFYFFKTGNLFLKSSLNTRMFIMSRLGVGKFFKFVDARGLIHLGNQSMRYLRPSFYKPRLRRSWALHEYMFDIFKRLQDALIINVWNRGFFKKMFFFFQRLFTKVVPLIKRILFVFRKKYVFRSLKLVVASKSYKRRKIKKHFIFRNYVKCLYYNLFISFYLKLLKQNITLLSSASDFKYKSVFLKRIFFLKFKRRFFFSMLLKRLPSVFGRQSMKNFSSFKSSKLKLKKRYDTRKNLLRFLEDFSLRFNDDLLKRLGRWNVVLHTIRSAYTKYRYFISLVLFLRRCPYVFYFNALFYSLWLNYHKGFNINLQVKGMEISRYFLFADSLFWRAFSKFGLNSFIGSFIDKFYYNVDHLTDLFFRYKAKEDKGFYQFKAGFYGLLKFFYFKKINKHSAFSWEIFKRYVYLRPYEYERRISRRFPINSRHGGRLVVRTKKYFSKFFDAFSRFWYNYHFTIFSNKSHSTSLNFFSTLKLNNKFKRVSSKFLGDVVSSLLNQMDLPYNSRFLYSFLKTAMFKFFLYTNFQERNNDVNIASRLKSTFNSFGLYNTLKKSYLLYRESSSFGSDVFSYSKYGYESEYFGERKSALDKLPGFCLGQDWRLRVGSYFEPKKVAVVNSCFIYNRRWSWAENLSFLEDVILYAVFLESITDDTFLWEIRDLREAMAFDSLDESYRSSFFFVKAVRDLRLILIYFFSILTKEFDYQFDVGPLYEFPQAVAMCRDDMVTNYFFNLFLDTSVRNVNSSSKVINKKSSGFLWLNSHIKDYEISFWKKSISLKVFSTFNMYFVKKYEGFYRPIIYRKGYRGPDFLDLDLAPFVRRSKRFFKYINFYFQKFSNSYRRLSNFDLLFKRYNKPFQEKLFFKKRSWYESMLNYHYSRKILFRWLEFNMSRPSFYDMKPLHRYRKLLFYKNFLGYFFLKENFNFNFFKLDNFFFFDQMLDYKQGNLVLFRFFYYKFRGLMKHFWFLSNRFLSLKNYIYMLTFILNFSTKYSSFEDENLEISCTQKTSYFGFKYFCLFFNFAKIRFIFLNYFYVFFRFLIFFKSFVDFFFALYFFRFFKNIVSTFMITSFKKISVSKSLSDFVVFVKKVKLRYYYFKSSGIDVDVKFFYVFRIIYLLGGRLFGNSSLNWTFFKSGFGLSLNISFFFRMNFLFFLISNLSLSFFRYFCLKKKILFIFKYFFLLFFKNFRLFLVLAGFVATSINRFHLYSDLLRFKFFDMCSSNSFDLGHFCEAQSEDTGLFFNNFRFFRNLALKKNQSSVAAAGWNFSFFNMIKSYKKFRLPFMSDLTISGFPKLVMRFKFFNFYKVFNDYNFLLKFNFNKIKDSFYSNNWSLFGYFNKFFLHFYDVLKYYRINGNNAFSSWFANNNVEVSTMSFFTSLMENIRKVNFNVKQRKYLSQYVSPIDSGSIYRNMFNRFGVKFHKLLFFTRFAYYKYHRLRYRLNFSKYLAVLHKYFYRRFFLRFENYLDLRTNNFFNSDKIYYLTKRFRKYYGNVELSLLGENRVRALNENNRLLSAYWLHVFKLVKFHVLPMFLKIVKLLKLRKYDLFFFYRIFFFKLMYKKGLSLKYKNSQWPLNNLVFFQNYRFI